MFVPVEGKVCFLSVTDKQYGDIVNFWGKKEKNKKAISGPVQLEIIW
jgi:CRISPR-associated protein Cas2